MEDQLIRTAWSGLLTPMVILKSKTARDIVSPVGMYLCVVLMSILAYVHSHFILHALYIECNAVLMMITDCPID